MKRFCFSEFFSLIYAVRYIEFLLCNPGRNDVQNKWDSKEVQIGEGAYFPVANSAKEQTFREC